MCLKDSLGLAKIGSWRMFASGHLQAVRIASRKNKIAEATRLGLPVEPSHQA